MTEEPLEIIRGDSYTIPISVTIDGVPVDITNYTFYLTVKTKDDVDSNDTNKIIQKIVGPGSHTDPVNGLTQILLTKTDTAQVPGQYVYDIQMADGSGGIFSITRSPFTIARDVTYTSNP